MMDAEGKFRRNVVLIALGHVLVIGAVVLLELRSEQPEVPEQVQWMDMGAMSGAPAARPDAPPPETPHPAASRHEEPTPVPPEPSLAPAANDDFATRRAIPAPTPTPTPTPKPTPTPTPKPTPTPTPRLTPTPTPKPKPTPTPKPKPTATLTPKPKKPKETPSPTKQPLVAKKNPSTDENSESPIPGKAKKSADKPGKADSAEQAAAKAAAVAAGIGAGGGSGEGAGHEGGSGRGGGNDNSSSVIGLYNDMIHDRLYGQWDQPTVAAGSAGGKIVAVLKVRIEKDGRISKAVLSSPSGVAAMDESVLATAARAKQLEPLPAILAKRGYYEVAIAFNRTDD